LKFDAVPSSGVVTTFQPALPPEILSNEANCHAISNGSLYVVETVPAKPIYFVTAASVDNNVRGSKRFKKWGMDFSLMCNPSAINTKSTPDCSAFCVTAI